MTCKDCICSEVCYYKAFNDEKNLKKRRDDVEKICKSFVHRDRLKNAPTVDAVEVVHAEWKDGVCSACDFDIRDMIDGESEFRSWVWECVPHCPNCGAKMDGERREGE